MCQYQTLYHNDSVGYVIRCTGCDRLQMGYGSVMITFGTEDFRRFCRKIMDLKEKHVPQQKPDLKSMIIPTPCEGMRFFLSERELYELHEMLETADLELKTGQLLHLFQNN